jgi:predicted adenine nucleotide alpha hydrolase (AANH) superfamily ATPase
MSKSLKLNEYIRPQLTAPDNAKKVLLHSCCAPCAGEVILAIQASGIEPTVFFYNPNIHPAEEYEIRKSENKRFCEDNNIPCIDADYDTDNWFERIKGLENEPERGERCTKCFDMRFERTALYAEENNFDVISSTLGISRWKDMNQINQSGVRSASRYDNVTYWTFNWRKQGGSQRMIELSKQENFYQQEYCGCVYSLRDTNRWRMANGRPRIKRLVKFYQENKQVEIIASDSSS